MKHADFKPGDVLFLERPVRGIEYPSGYYVLRSVLDEQAFLSLVSENSEGLCPADVIYMIASEDLAAFSPTGARANLDGVGSIQYGRRKDKGPGDIGDDGDWWMLK